MKKLLFLMLVVGLVNLNAFAKPSVNASSSKIAKYLINMASKAKSHNEVAKKLKPYLLKSANLEKSAKKLFFQVNRMKDKAKQKGLKREIYLHSESLTMDAILAGVKYSEMINWVLYKGQNAGGSFMITKVKKQNKFEIRKAFY